MVWAAGGTHMTQAKQSLSERNIDRRGRPPNAADQAAGRLRDWHHHFAPADGIRVVFCMLGAPAISIETPMRAITPPRALSPGWTVPIRPDDGASSRGIEQSDRPASW